MFGKVGIEPRRVCPHARSRYSINLSFARMILSDVLYCTVAVPPVSSCPYKKFKNTLFLQSRIPPNLRIKVWTGVLGTLDHPVVKRGAARRTSSHHLAGLGWLQFSAL